MPSMETELTEIVIERPIDALEAFGRAKYDPIRGKYSVPILARPKISGFPWVSIPKGVFALKSRSGKIIPEPMEPGFHLMNPFEVVSYLITPQNTMYDIPVRNSPTKDNMHVTIDIFLMFKIFNPYLFIQKLGGATKLGDVLKTSQEEAVRSLANSTYHHKIYDLVRFDEDDIVKSLTKKFEPYGVKITDIMITDVGLPKSIANNLQKETTYLSKNRLQKKENDYKKLLVLNRESQEKTIKFHNNARLKQDEEEKKKRAEIQKLNEEIMAKTKKITSEIQAEQNRISGKILEESKKKADIFNSKKNAYLKERKAKAEAEVLKIKTESQNFINQKYSEIRLLEEKNKAKITQIEAETEKIVAESLKAKRELVIQLNKIKILEGLKDNSNNLVIQGKSKGNIVSEMIASQLHKDIFIEN